MKIKHNIHRALHLLIISLIFSWMFSMNPVQATTNNIGVVFTIDGPIGPATSDYIHRGFEEARDKNARIIIIEMDTPGGLDTSMRAIIRDILSSAIPVITYVTPNGARAASAGTYILFASHLAVMAPGTNLGAATPIQISAPISPGAPEEGEKIRTHPGLEEKMINDSVAYIKSLADLQGRNKVWAEKFVREAASLSAHEAFEVGVIEILAENLTNLLSQADGRLINLHDQKYRLVTKNMEVVKIDPDWRTQLLEIITNPNIAYLLLIIGIYGLIFEFTTPGAVAPGVIGAICLLLGLYALHVLPVSYTGLALIFLGLAFILTEAYIPSFGALGIGGVIAFIIGSIMLLDTGVPGFEIYWPLIFVMAGISGGFLLLVASMALRSQSRPSVIGGKTFLHKEGRALVWKDHQGMIKIRGESWQAESADPIKPGDIVIVEDIEGLTLKVRKKQQGDNS